MKYGNKKTGGYHSKKESRRAGELQLLEKIGAISDLKEQVKFELIPKQDGERAVCIIVDFTYNESGAFIAEDTKGFRTKDYIIKRKLLLWVHGIKVRET